MKLFNLWILAKENLIRVKGENSHRVTYAELFFDLVFVLAIIMISHRLVEHFDFRGIVETFMLLLVVWWAWMYTCWATNWLNPEKNNVRIMLFAAMFVGLVMTVSIPYAFSKKALLFASAYVVLQLGRSLYMIWVFAGHNKTRARNFLRISIWATFSAIFWILGGLSEEYRLFLWLFALGIEFLSPTVNMWLPFMGKSKTSEWNIEGAHMAERCALFIIIAIGETILVIGRTVSGSVFSSINMTAFFVTFLGTVCLWWIYFNVGVERGSKKISQSNDPGAMGRLAYTYVHILIICGIILVASADEIILAHPEGHIEPITLIAIVGGPLLYLLGNLIFKKIVYGFYPQSHIMGIILLSLSLIAWNHISPLAMGGVTVSILFFVAGFETFANYKNRI